MLGPRVLPALGIALAPQRGAGSSSTPSSGHGKLVAYWLSTWDIVVTTLALVVYGVLQERMMTRGWGPQQELFPFSSFLVLSNRLFTVCVLLAHTLACRAWGAHGGVPAARLRSYCLVSGSNMVSTLCQYEALKHVSFVAQTLAKTAKALPVVLWGTLVGGKVYRPSQYAHAIAITGGCSMFVLGGDITAGAAHKGEGGWQGYAAGGLLLLAYLAADGWTSTQQEHLYKVHDTSIQEQLLFTTAFSSIYSLAATLAGRQLLPALRFLGRHPPAAWAVVLLSAMSTVIQVCISSVLSQHGALMFALMMTTRQCASVLLSTLLFGHALSLLQWLAVAVVFAALYLQKTSHAARRGGGAGGKGPALPRLSTAGGAVQPGLQQPLLGKAGFSEATSIQLGARPA